MVLYNTSKCTIEDVLSSHTKMVPNTACSVEYFVEMYSPDVFLYRTTLNFEVTTVCSDIMNCDTIVSFHSYTN